MECAIQGCMLTAGRRSKQERKVMHLDVESKMMFKSSKNTQIQTNRRHQWDTHNTRRRTHPAATQGNS